MSNFCKWNDLARRAFFKGYEVGCQELNSIEKAKCPSALAMHKKAWKDGYWWGIDDAHEADYV